LHSLLQKRNSFLASFVYFGYHTSMEHTELASMGGKARAKSLTKKRRKEIASMGGKAGGRGRKKGQERKRRAGGLPGIE
jgi:hypothetical protein